MITHLGGNLNPFSTRSGALPDYLLGRDHAVAAIEANLANPTRDENGNLLFIGLRGIGKTVMLTEAARLAKARGWLVLNSYLLEGGLLTRLHRGLNELEGSAKESISAEMDLRLLKASKSVKIELPERNLIDRFRNILATKKAPGLLITVDEVHSTAGDAQKELREYGNEIQLAHRENLPVMSVTAGLPGGISTLLKDEDQQNKRTGATFLRRAAKEYLDDISDEEIWNAYSMAATETDRLVSAEVLDFLTESAKGYPYLFQLIGHRVWQSGDKVINMQSAKVGVRSAIRRLGSAVLDTSLSDLSTVDKTFLLAMAQDEGPSKMSDIVERTGISSSQAANYKKRLKESEMVSGDKGYVYFTIPYMREHLREHHASTIRSKSPRRIF